MSVMRNRPKGARLASFGLGLCVFTVIPAELGYQDVASLLARQPGVAERWQKRVVSSSAASIQVATFSFGLPIGTSMPQPPRTRLAALGGDASDVTGSLGGRNPLMQRPRRYEAADFPAVDRALKGDRLALFNPLQAAPDASPATPEDPNASNASVRGAKTAEAAAPLDPELVEALQAPPLTADDLGLPLQADAHDANTSALALGEAQQQPTPLRDGFTVQPASLFFGTSSLGSLGESLEQWQPGEEPTIVLPPGVDPDLKVTSLPAPSAAIATGESVASKGEVNADNQRLKTPAERLGLHDPKLRARHEKCLSDAIYFEARGEAVRGQIAVAQVVLNRAFSGFYPTTVCGVVYQNKHRHLACQFTFACDKVADVVREPAMWDRAKRISKAMLDGQLWLPEVAKSTHYHAYWVRPNWVREMRKMYRSGVHTFYRPRNWGDGSDAPSWGTPEETAAISAKLAEAARSSAEINGGTVRR